MLRDYVGPLRDWAEAIAWGRPEPIPGWRIRWTIDSGRYTFSLIDLLDPCAFEVRAADPAAAGRPDPARQI
jgi:hypothetical protein